MTRHPFFVALLLCAAIYSPLGASRETRRQTPVPAPDEVQRLQDSIATITELATAPDDNIPRSLLANAQAIVVIPSLVKGGFIVGAKHGRGVMSARDETRTWSAPVFVTMTGASIGWQIGVQSVDLALLVMNRRGVDSLLDDKFTIGGDLSVAAGPVGRSAGASTDAKVNSQILAYSRAKGLFAGATLEGASIHPDADANRAFYGRLLNPRTILSTPATAPGMPPVVARWRETLASVSGVATLADRR